MIAEKPKKVIKDTSLYTEKLVLDTKDTKSYTNIHEITLAQKNVINMYKSNTDIHRIIHYGGGGIGIELKNASEFKTIYVNRQGIEEFKWNQQIRVLDMDKVIFSAEKPSTQLQENIGKAVMLGDNVKAYYSKNEIIEGIITHIYGIANECLCISFEYKGRKSSTAIPRSAVIEIIKKGDIHEQI
jgi:hypothetical protein